MGLHLLPSILFFSLVGFQSGLLNCLVPVQVAVSTATTPNPEFHFKYNNSQYVGSKPIALSAIPRAIHLYAVIHKLQGRLWKWSY